MIQNKYYERRDKLLIQGLVQLAPLILFSVRAIYITMMNVDEYMNGNKTS